MTYKNKDGTFSAFTLCGIFLGTFPEETSALFFINGETT